MLAHAQRIDEEHKEKLYRLLVDSAVGYGMFTLDAQGNISSWNSGAERLFGYAEDEALGQSGTIIFTTQDQVAHAPEYEMNTAATQGQAENERCHVRKDGSLFFGTGLVFPLKNRFGR